MYRNHGPMVVWDGVFEMLHKYGGRIARVSGLVCLRLHVPIDDEKRRI